VRRSEREARGGQSWSIAPIPKTTVIVHGAEPAGGRATFEAAVRDNVIHVERVIWAVSEDALALAREAMELRGNRYLVTVHGSAKLEPRWLDALAAQVEPFFNAWAASAAPELPVGLNVRSLAADARCTLLSLRKLPQHVRLDTDFDTLDGAMADLLLRAVDLRLGTRGVDRRVAQLPPLSPDARFEERHGMTVADVLTSASGAIEKRLRAVQPRKRGLVSIVTLSWNAVQFTKIALESIRTFTSEPYEVIVVDNGSGSETTEYLRSIDDPHVRIIYNSKNFGFGGGNNVGMAAARGEYVVVLNNDVIVTDGWLDGLLAPFDRMPTLGVTAPRSNVIAGSQLVVDASYSDAEGIAKYARERRERWRHQGYITERVIGFCMCIDRRVIDEIGGFDPIFGLGNFEDDDLCVRIRAAGYGIFVCDDVFIHHFGSQSFRANNVNYLESMTTNWQRFAAKWGYTHALDPQKGYDPRSASYTGFDRAMHYVPLPVPPAERRIDAVRTDAQFDVAFSAVVRDDGDWQNLSTFVRRFSRAFSEADRALLAIAAIGDIPAETLGLRVERVLTRADIDPERAATIDVSDVDDEQAWAGSLNAPMVVCVADVDDASPAGLRRYLREAAS
jgi:GT2 family glycosyltransferase